MEEDAATAGRGHCDNSLSIPFKVDGFSPDTFVVVEVFLGNKAFAFFHILEDKECGGALVEAISTGPFDPSQGTGQFFLDEPVALFPLFHFTNAGSMEQLMTKFIRSEFRLLASCAVIWNPFSANWVAGFMSSYHLSFPYFLWASHIPSTVPGTPAARAPNLIFLFCTRPRESWYMVSVAPAGAFSR